MLVHHMLDHVQPEEHVFTLLDSEVNLTTTVNYHENIKKHTHTSREVSTYSITVGLCFGGLYRLLCFEMKSEAEFV